MTKLLSLPDEFQLARRVHGLFDDFTDYVADVRWSLITAVDGSATLGDAVGGKIAIVSAAVTADNEDTYLKSVKETFKFAADKPLVFEALVDFTEAATNQANVLVGLIDAVAGDTLLDDGGGLKASYSGAAFFKTDGSTVWSCGSSIGASQVTTVTETTAGGAAAQRLRIEFQPNTATDGEVRFYVDDALVAKHAISFASATEMQIALGVKDGGAGDEETLNVDYVGCFQLR